MIKELVKKCSKYGVFNGVVLMLTIGTLTNTCWWLTYQPNIPEKLKEI
jgi:cyclic lactone autoinducer peptide